MSHQPREGSQVNVSSNSNVWCPQWIGGVFGEEDCLMLNIYVPEQILLSGRSSADVMVWLTGGALLIGSNDIGKSRCKYVLVWMHRNAYIFLFQAFTIP